MKNVYLILLDSLRADHVFGNKFASEKWNLELYIHKADLPLLENAKNIG